MVDGGKELKTAHDSVPARIMEAMQHVSVDVQTTDHGVRVQILIGDGKKK